MLRALHALDLLGLALVHHLTGEALGSELLLQLGDLLVQRLRYTSRVRLNAKSTPASVWIAGMQTAFESQ